ncbi:hypothetical protein DVH24_036657 [Malus domestica]|uniref:Uncharacterized protein n=1 Tax=Malus domestica TaxID=3750 RepID=A0A498IG17_MALDO|nr:hypothetical protein DVH24_036657 [Malus domestica]
MDNTNEKMWNMCGCWASHHEAFWEFTDFGFHRNSEVKRDRSKSIPMLDNPLGSSRVSNSQKQNREDVVGAQS